MKKLVVLFISMWSVVLIGAEETSMAKPVSESLEKQTYLGIQVKPLQPETASQLDIDPEMGLVVSYVEKGSPAEKAGIERHDILLKFDDQLLIGTRQIGVLVRSRDAGESVSLSYVRKGKKDTMKVKLDEKVAPPHQGIHFMGDTIHVMDGNVAGTVSAFPAEHFTSSFGNFAFKNEELEKRMESIRERFENSEGHPMTKSMPLVNIHGNGGVMMWKDESAKIDIRHSEDGKTVTIRDREGNEIFNGPLNSADDAAKVPEEFRLNLKAIELIGAPKGGGI